MTVPVRKIREFFVYICLFRHDLGVCCQRYSNRGTHGGSDEGCFLYTLLHFEKYDHPPRVNASGISWRYSPTRIRLSSLSRSALYSGSPSACVVWALLNEWLSSCPARHASLSLRASLVHGPAVTSSFSGWASSISFWILVASVW